jgi:hypothetical protein
MKKRVQKKWGQGMVRGATVQYDRWTQALELASSELKNKLYDHWASMSSFLSINTSHLVKGYIVRKVSLGDFCHWVKNKQTVFMQSKVATMSLGEIIWWNHHLTHGPSLTKMALFDARLLYCNFGYIVSTKGIEQITTAVVKSVCYISTVMLNHCI